jgi:hypothetical protein
MSHWFDRLATWSAEGDAGEEQRLTRREIVGGAAVGAGAASLLASPFITKAFGESAACACWREAINNNTKVGHQLVDNLIFTPSSILIGPLNLAIFTVAYAGLNAGTVAKAISCGNCDNAPSGKKPPPKFQPCTQRGGVRLRGDQCGGGDGGGATGGSGCGGGTSSCPTPGGGDLCCFGSDLCCSGCCCIAEVGCSCCG